MAQLKIHYFAAPGRAEVARLCLTIGKVPYEVSSGRGGGRRLLPPPYRPPVPLVCGPVITMRICIPRRRPAPFPAAGLQDVFYTQATW